MANRRNRGGSSLENNKTEQKFVIDIDRAIYKRMNKNYYLNHTSISDFGQIISNLYNDLREEENQEGLDKLESFINYFFKSLDKEHKQIDKSNIGLYQGLLEVISFLKTKGNKVTLEFLNIFSKVPNEEQLNYIKATNTIIKAERKFKNDFNNLSKLLYASDVILSFAGDQSAKIKFFNKLFTNIISINNLVGINNFFTEVGIDVKELKVINKWLFRRRLEELPDRRLDRANNTAIKDNKYWLYKSLEVNDQSYLGKSVNKLYDNLKDWNNKKALVGFEDFITNLLHRANKGNSKGVKTSMRLLTIFQEFDGGSLEDYERLFSTISSFKKVNYNITFNWIDAFAKMPHLARVKFIKATDLLLSFDEKKDGRILVDFEYTVGSILCFKIFKKRRILLLNRFLDLIIECDNQYEANGIFDKIGISNGRHIDRRRLERGLRELEQR
ncbi:hypothetical protein U472_07020 [Orenia metallireducens]|uniref:Uncharacterized protein n=1 Tax=Orenia metallireducens TaxID=1413210 RepID=A0A1C0AA97_9FIRM|nr:hypothetical protein [Orenia metallireducens]OCL27214.1 hypothetical protein U472_07020 [Orenia metallireducens]